MDGESYGTVISFLGEQVDVLIDRHRTTKHPEIPTLVYEIDYGYIPHTLSGDGEEIDAYVLRDPSEHTVKAHGLCIGVILRHDGDDKLIVAAGSSFERVSSERVWQLTAFQERFFWPEDYVTCGGCRYRFSHEGVEKVKVNELK